MFILSLRYTAPMERIDELLPDHVAWLRSQHEAGIFMAWGRKVPREGGVIFAKGDSRAEIEALAKTDPFVANGAAEVKVIEWAPTFVEPGLEQLTA
ncbi:YciI family protein [Stakelama sediminis]|uniref:Uncharacterized protein YciI n=1 Tax=Stakelama sediminis TaxID=463200 RepID=A0A840YUM2_9SPHN|nr:uncharacterized protein YciI [Stakelama sediminis]